MMPYELDSTIRLPLDSFDWKPEIDEPGYKVQGKLFGDRREAMKMNWPYMTMPMVVEVFNEVTGRKVPFRQRVNDTNRYYSMNSDYLIEIYFVNI